MSALLGSQEVLTVLWVFSEGRGPSGLQPPCHLVCNGYISEITKAFRQKHLFYETPVNCRSSNRLVYFHIGGFHKHQLELQCQENSGHTHYCMVRLELLQVLSFPHPAPYTHTLIMLPDHSRISFRAFPSSL